MDRIKLKHFKFNLFWCLSSFMIPFLALYQIEQMNVWASAMIGFYIYFLDVKGQTDSDWISERVKILEDK